MKEREKTMSRMPAIKRRGMAVMIILAMVLSLQAVPAMADETTGSLPEGVIYLGTTQTAGCFLPYNADFKVVNYQNSAGNGGWKNANKGAIINKEGKVLYTFEGGTGQDAGGMAIIPKDGKKALIKPDLTFLLTGCDTIYAFPEDKVVVYQKDGNWAIITFAGKTPTGAAAMAAKKITKYSTHSNDIYVFSDSSGTKWAYNVKMKTFYKYTQWGMDTYWEYLSKDRKVTYTSSNGEYKATLRKIDGSKISLSKKYREIEPYNKLGLAKVALPHKVYSGGAYYGYINKSGKEVIPTSRKYSLIFMNSKGYSFATDISKKYIYIMNKTGRITKTIKTHQVYPLTGIDYSSDKVYNSNLAIAWRNKDDKTALINSSGKIVSGYYKDIMYKGGYFITEGAEKQSVYGRKTYGILSNTGKVIVPAKYSRTMLDKSLSSDNRIYAGYNRIDRKENVQLYYKDGSRISIDGKYTFDTVGWRNNGTAIVYYDDVTKYALVNRYGKVLYKGVVANEVNKYSYHYIEKNGKVYMVAQELLTTTGVAGI